MTGFESKRQMAQAKLDDDTQVYADTLTIVYQRGFADGKQAAQRKPEQEPKRVVKSNGRYSPLLTHMMNKRDSTPPAQPEQEPVAYGMWDTMIGYGGRMMMVRLDKGQDGCTVPLYTTPPAAQRPWQGLEIEEVQDSYNSDYQAQTRAVEAKLKERNT